LFRFTNRLPPDNWQARRKLGLCLGANSDRLLGERKLKVGEELQFPDTEISKKLREVERIKAQELAAAEEAGAPADELAATTSEASEDGLSLFGADRRSAAQPSDPEAEAERQKNARFKAVHYFQHTLLPNWIHDYRRNIVENMENGNIDVLVTQAQMQVDEGFANRLVLHPFPEKEIYVLEFEAPEKVGDYFFAAVLKNEYGGFSFFSLEKGLSFFGAGDESILYEWDGPGDFSDLGGRKYSDLASFIQELETGPAFQDR
ncbi:hypothetical protein P4E94_19075, partial [Pontiellaceae bacterium B12219]|nr:hypothetical protein [Pontiellaceae bacterium B12219]